MVCLLEYNVFARVVLHSVLCVCLSVQMYVCVCHLFINFGAALVFQPQNVNKCT